MKIGWGVWGSEPRRRVRFEASPLTCVDDPYNPALPSVWYCLTDSSLLTMASHTVQQALSQEGFYDFQSRWVLLATWHNVTNSTYSTYAVYTRLTLVYYWFSWTRFFIHPAAYVSEINVSFLLSVSLWEHQVIKLCYVAFRPTHEIFATSAIK